MLGQDRYWNGRIRGIGGAATQCAAACISFLLDGLSTYLTRPNLCSAGRGVVIQRGVVVRYPRRIELGDYVRIGRGVHIVSDLTTGTLIVGKGTWIGKKCRLDFSGGLVIGEDCTLSENVTILTHDHGLTPHSTPEGKMLKIGKKVWIGANVMILPQVREIGDDSIVGAGAVVTTSVPPAVVFGGNPGRVIRENIHVGGDIADRQLMGARFSS